MKYVLFVCNHNAGRSQMAQAFFERHGPDDMRAESAKLDAIRSDQTAHQLRLAQLLPSLAEEFEQDHSARQCLRAETCDVLEVAR